MINDKKCIAIIPARGGSVGLPGKNIRELCGKPLIAWTIEVAHQAEFLDAVVISTDDLEIANVANDYGCEVPFLRPAHLASDTSSSVDAIEHALIFLSNHGRSFDIIVLLEPTSPLREATDIDRALTQLIDSDADSIVGICQAETVHPAFMYWINDQKYLFPFMTKQPDGLRRQDIDKLFFLEGTIYASKVTTLLNRRSFYHERTIGYEVPKWKSPEIDDEIDFLLVEAIMKHRGIGL